MDFQERLPHPSLRSRIRCYWWLRSAAPSAAEPALPDGSPELIVSLGDAWEHVAPDGTVTRQPSAFLVGQIVAPMTVRPSGRAHLVAVRFESHGAAMLVDDVQSLTGRWVPLDALDTSLRALPVALDADHSIDAQCRVLDEALLAHPAPVDTVVAGAVAALRATHGAAEVDALARTLGVTPRTLQRRFAAQVGVSPKVLARIIRFQRVFAAWRDDPMSLSRVALDCGYFDQSHLVRDFRDFAGAPPAGFLSQLSDFTASFTAASRHRQRGN